jgi:hypothetical protein
MQRTLKIGKEKTRYFSGLNTAVAHPAGRLLTGFNVLKA